MPSIVCLIIDPSRIVREGLTRILAQSAFDPVCIAPSVGDVPCTIANAGEQILVLTGVREKSGLAKDLGAIRARFPDAQVVVVGDANTRDLVMTALGLGATSFVDENVATSNLIKELELVMFGEPVISTSILKRVLGDFSSSPGEETVATPAVDEPQQPQTQGQVEQKQLSSREAAILSALVQGASNKMIACQLKITEATVKVHVKAILRKIRVKNRTQAAIWALKRRGAPKRLTEFQPEGLLRFGGDLGDQLARRGAACEAPECVPSRALSAKNDGSWPRQPALGYEKVDSLMIEHGPGEGSRRSAAPY